MIRLKKILVPVDFSDNSLAALRYAVRFAARFGSSLRVIHVIEPPTFMSNLQNVPLTLSNEQVAAKTHAELDSFVASEVPESITTAQVVRRGVPYDEIAAEAMGIDTTRFKVMSFVISSMFAGIAGGLFGHFEMYLHPNSFLFTTSFYLIIMIVVGGLGSIEGAILGAILVTVWGIDQWVSSK